jgi:hypothetical protein
VRFTWKVGRGLLLESFWQIAWCFATRSSANFRPQILQAMRASSLPAYSSTDIPPPNERLSEPAEHPFNG